MDEKKIEELVKRAVLADLDGVEFIQDCSYAELAAAYNGIGPEWLPGALREKVTKYLALFEPAALIHDMRYAKADGSADRFHHANLELRDNCLRLCDYTFSWYSWRRYAGYLAALKIFDACENFGTVAYAAACGKIALAVCCLFAAGCLGIPKAKDVNLKGMYANAATETVAIGSAKITLLPDSIESFVAHYSEDTAWLNPDKKTHALDIYLTGTNSTQSAEGIVKAICEAFCCVGNGGAMESSRPTDDNGEEKSSSSREVK